MQPAVVDVFCDCPEKMPAARSCAAAMGCAVNSPGDSALYRISFSADGVSLKSAVEGEILPIKVNFTGGKAAHRRQFGGGRGQPIAKAVGLQVARVTPHVFDATAGLGGDAFVLASLGCRVTMAERSPVAHALLSDGLQRARQVATLGADTALLKILDNMTLLSIDSHRMLDSAGVFVADVVYLDPMFPERGKSAAVKKEMQAFHQLIGDDSDAATLLNLALKAAEYRVVVKRPRLAEPLGGRAPGHQLMGKSTRFDIYPVKALSKLGLRAE